MAPLPFGFPWGLTTGQHRHAFGGREESEVRLYVLPVRLPWLPSSSKGLCSCQHIKNRSPSLDEITQVWMLSSHLAPSVPRFQQLPPLTASELCTVTSPEVPHGPRGFSIPCYTSVKSSFTKPFSNFSIQETRLFPSGTLLATNSKQVSYFCHP